MSKRYNSGDYRSFYQMIILIITAIGIAIKFLIEVNKRGLWKECGISVGIFAGVNYVVYLISEAVKNSDYFLLSLLITFIAFCVYWSFLFNDSVYSQFSKFEIRKNSAYWQQSQWWWTLDGWQFEEEVAKIFITQGYKATVTKGSGDGGVDIILKRGDYTAIVQCKHYQNPVPPEPIRALWGCKDDFNADEVILVASSGITDSGARFVANKPNFKVLNLSDIIEMSNRPPVEYNPPKPKPKHEPVKIEPAKNEPAKTNSNKTAKSRTGRRIDW